MKPNPLADFIDALMPIVFVLVLLLNAAGVFGP
jgi:hypothetical protein